MVPEELAPGIQKVEDYYQAQAIFDRYANIQQFEEIISGFKAFTGRPYYVRPDTVLEGERITVWAGVTSMNVQATLKLMLSPVHASLELFDHPVEELDQLRLEHGKQSHQPMYTIRCLLPPPRIPTPEAPKPAAKTQLSGSYTLEEPLGALCVRLVHWTSWRSSYKKTRPPSETLT